LRDFPRLGLKAAEFFCLYLSNIPSGREVNRMTAVILRPNESQDGLLKRFRKKVVKSGVLSTVRRKRWFVSKSELRRVEKKKAIRRIKRRNIGPRIME
jgi:small subunit ribosomal protein S21